MSDVLAVAKVHPYQSLHTFNFIMKYGSLNSLDGGNIWNKWSVDNVPEAIMMISMILNAMAAGVIFIFSNTVMPALATLKESEGIIIMNEINTIIVNPLFLLVFFGGLISAYPTYTMWMNAEYCDAARYYAVAATLVFFFGNFMVTGTQNVPMNNHLQKVDPMSDEGAAYWRNTYLTSWVAWNTARGIFATLAAFLGALSLKFMTKRKI